MLNETIKKLERIKAVLPERKRARIQIEADGRTPKIYIDNQPFEFDYKNPTRLSQADINEILKLDFVEEIKGEYSYSSTSKSKLFEESSRLMITTTK